MFYGRLYPYFISVVLFFTHLVAINKQLHCCPEALVSSCLCQAISSVLVDSGCGILQSAACSDRGRIKQVDILADMEKDPFAMGKEHIYLSSKVFAGAHVNEQ